MANAQQVEVLDGGGIRFSRDFLVEVGQDRLIHRIQRRWAGSSTTRPSRCGEQTDASETRDGYARACFNHFSPAAPWADVASVSIP